MLISIVLTLQARDAGTLSAEQGRANYAELLSRLELVLPGEGARLHDWPGVKPLSQRAEDTYWFAMFHLLADFAFYAGAGVQTASGMGQCRHNDR